MSSRTRASAIAVAEAGGKLKRFTERGKRILKEDTLRYHEKPSARGGGVGLGDHAKIGLSQTPQRREAHRPENPPRHTRLKGS